MKVIASAENSKFLVEANEEELKAILKSVTGNSPAYIKIGQKIPAIDYASSITDVKKLAENPDFKELEVRLEAFTREFNKIKNTVQVNANIVIE